MQVYVYTLSLGSLCAHRSVNPRGNASAYTPAKPETVATPGRRRDLETRAEQRRRGLETHAEQTHGGCLPHRIRGDRTRHETPR